MNLIYRKLIALSTAFLFIFCFQQAEAQSHTCKYEAHSRVDIKKAERVEMTVSMLAGELNISAENQAQLMFGEYFYDDPVYGEPIRSYEVTEKVGYLKIGNGDIHDLDLDSDEECIWNMKLNKKMPTEMTINMAAGEGNIMLEGAALDKFSFALKAGQANIDLRNTSVPRINFKAIAGEANIDISGIWRNDLKANLKGGVGNLNLVLPKKYNLEIEITGLIGEVNTSGLDKENGYYVRHTSSSEPTLYIDITGGIGSVDLKIEE